MERYAEINREAINTKEVLTFREAVLYTGLSESCLYKKTSMCEIPHYKPSGKQVFFKRKELEEYLLSNRIATNAEIEQAATSYVVTGQHPRK
ncbi:MAG: helix-turn-helix domain-containing protein [Bacteroidales bacterium]|nr:helix-turn-helix domain-containing protein [Bacteroidales bacterium]